MYMMMTQFSPKAPSPKALQMFIDICIGFAMENDILYNEEKTKCMCIKPFVMNDLYVPMFHLGHLNIKAVEKETYLGYIINTSMSDDDHIIKEIRNIYMLRFNPKWDIRWLRTKQNRE